MKNIIKTILFASSAFLFMGCPYKTKVQLETNPSEKVQSKFLGTYEKKGSTTYRFEVKKKTATLYEVDEIKTSDDKLAKQYEAYTTTIKGTTFLVTWQTRSYSTKYTKENADFYLYKLESNSSGTIAKLTEVTDNITEEFESAAELRAFIAKNKDLSFFYNKKAAKYYKADELD